MSQIPDYIPTDNPFLYGALGQFGAGKPFYKDLPECVLNTFSIQVDHVLQQNEAADINN